MSTHGQRTNQALQIALGLLLSLLAYQGRLICEHVSQRLDRLERQQTLILVHLGIPPVACDTLESGVKNGLCAGSEEIKRIKLARCPENPGYPLDTDGACGVHSP